MPVPVSVTLSLLAAAVVFIASRRRRGWSVVAGHAVWRPVSWLLLPLSSLGAGASLDPFTRPQVLALASRGVALLQPFGDWFHAPRFAVDFVALLPLLAVILLDLWHAPLPAYSPPPPRGRGRGKGQGPSTATLLRWLDLAGILALALALRWTDALNGPPASDTVGYFNTGRDFAARVSAEDTNPIALAYLNVHPNAREPLYPVLLSLVFSFVGPSLLHQREVAVLASVANVSLTYAFGRAALGTAAGLGAALLLALEPWHISMSQEGLREPWSILFVYGLALLALRASPRRLSVLLGAGALGAAAVLTRLDAGGTVMLLLAWLSGRLGARWRRSWPAWAVFTLLVAPLLIANQARAGEALTPLGSSMGGDIQAAVGPLISGEMPLSSAARYVAAGTLEVYHGTLFGQYDSYVGEVFGAVFAWLAVALFAAGLAAVAWRGPRLVALVSTVGVFVPPFVFIAGIGLLGGPGGGYTERYTYMIAPAVLALTAWSAWQAVRWCATSASRRLEWRRHGPGT